MIEGLPTQRASNVRLIRQLMDRSNLSGEERWLAVAIAYHRNEVTYDCFPSQRLLSRITGIPQRQVARIVDRLRKKRVLETKEFAENGHKALRHQLRYYFLTDHKMDVVDGEASNGGGCSVTETRGSGSINGLRR